MITPRLTLTVLAASLAIGATAAPASADVADGQSSTSTNWAGYQIASQSGDGFSKVSGSWIEPTVDCAAGHDQASFWVGLGGSGGGTGALEQAGTGASCDGSGTATHNAWYELLPAAPVQLDLAISPGDRVSSTVSVSDTTVTVYMADQTTGKAVTKTLQMDSPDASTAEWIAEAPSACDGSGNCQPMTLANFGTVTFSNASATSAGHTGTIADSEWSAQPVALTPAAGDSGFAATGDGQGTGGAEPSGLSGDGSSFSVGYVAGSDLSAAASPALVDPSGGYDPAGGYGGWGGYDPSSGYDPSAGYGGSGGYGSSGDYYPSAGYYPSGGVGPSAFL
jgi:hypothetical protein